MFKYRIAFFIVLVALPLAVALSPAAGAETGAIEVRFENHRFVPQHLRAPAGRPLTLEVVNSSKETIEFESFKLNREQTVSPGETATVHLPKLSPGAYDFYDDSHPDVPQGKIVVK